MLVLTRRPRERIFIETPQGRVTIVLLDINYRIGYARLGIEAPPSIKIDREEISLLRDLDTTETREEKDHG